jgi:hypothetical protein
LSYSFKGHFKSIYPPISLEYWPLELVRPSLLAFMPSLTYTLIGLWWKSTLKTFLITFLELLFLESCVMPRGFWWALSPLPCCVWYSFFFLLLTWVACGRGHHYWIIFMHKAWWPPKRYLICFGPLSNSFKDHRLGPQQRISITNEQYPHHGAYEWDYPCLWPLVDPINHSWA